MSTLLLFICGMAMAENTEPTAAAPEAVEPTARPVKFALIETDASHLMVTHVTDIPLDLEGSRTGDDWLYHHRSRSGFTVSNDQVSFAAQADIFTGYFGGNTWDVPGTVDARGRHQTGLYSMGNFTPRQASVTANLPGAQIQAGLTTSHWGLGMLANDGDHQPWFGVSEFGDRVIRMRVSSSPSSTSRLSFTAAYDRVVEDDMARWADGQWARQGLVAIVYRDEASRTLGVYGVLRRQEEILEDRQTDARVLDIYGSTPVPLVGNQKLTISAEIAGIVGRTDRATTYNSTESVRVASGAATGLISYGTADDRYTAHLSTGWASGDGDSDDGVSSDFRFDRDFGVGQVLFDEVLGAIDAAAHHTLSDPQYSGQAPDGLDATVSEGAVQHATFVQPVLEAKPLKWLQLRAGGAIAWSTKPIAQRFYTHRAGGSPRNQFNEPTSSYHLGTELDWSVVLDGRSSGFFDLVLSGGHLYVGEALQGAGMDRVDLYRAMLRF
jgi:hypothetical protein